VGTVVGVNSKHLQIRFDDQVVEIEKDSAAMKDLSLAYAMTFHKGQGSEFPCAIVLIHKAHDFMHHRNLLYTAVTRGKKLVVLVGARKVLAMAVKRVEAGMRITTLTKRMVEFGGCG
jgi:exodeoxyribonuclease V alpha subunit